MASVAMERTPSTAVVKEASPEPAALPEEAEPEELAGVLLFPQAARLAVRARARIRVKNFFIFQYFLLFRFAAERRIYGSIRRDLSRRTSARIAPPPGNVNDFSHVFA